MQESPGRRIARLAAAWLAAVIALAGCGQKGPLYLPEEDENKEKEAALETYERFSEHGLL